MRPLSFLWKKIPVQLGVISSGVKGKENRSHLPWSGRQKALALSDPISMKFILIANTKQLRGPLPGLSGGSSEVPVSGLLPLAVYTSFAHSWFPYMQVVAHLTCNQHPFKSCLGLEQGKQHHFHVQLLQLQWALCGNVWWSGHCSQRYTFPGDNHSNPKGW